MNKKNIKSLIILLVLIFLIVFGFSFIKFTKAATNIGPLNASSTNIWAWNDDIGWLDFYDTNNVTVSNSGISGYASSTSGWVALDCATAPAGGCAINYGVSNDSFGYLAGWAWNDTVGWISFCGNATSASTWNGFAWVCPSNHTYQVSISPYGDFHGWAWNDTVGWISFNYSDTSGYNPYWVETSWQPTSTSGTLDSSTFDTGVTNAAFNSAVWLGDSLPSGASVQFQIAVSTSSSGPWNFTGQYYSAAEGIPMTLWPNLLATGRYFRYRLYLYSGTGQIATPKITKVIVNWSR